ncbi:uncharacterized protein METZ01_LOCUS410682, partial [marine metagenome]
MIYGYIRKSSEEGSTSSFDTQKFKITSYCNIHNLKVDEWFEDLCSGGLLINQREQGMLLSTKLARGDSIICSNLDRYSRSHYGLVNDVEKYKRLKIKLIFTDLGDVISSDSLGSVFYQILSIMSEWYRKSLSEKQKVAQDKLKKQGRYRGGKCDFGFDIGENNQLVSCEKQQRELNLVLGLRQKGKKFNEIKSEMERYTGRKWHISFIHKLIQRQKEEQYEKKIT